MDIDKLRRNLLDFDEEVYLMFGGKERFMVLVVGGSALLLQGQCAQPAAI